MLKHRAPQNTPDSEEAKGRSRQKSITLEASDEAYPHYHYDRLLKRKKSKGSSLGNMTSRSIEMIHCSCERLKIEMEEFIDDFVESQEYHDYLSFKKSIVKIEKAVQYDEEDLKRKVSKEMVDVKKKPPNFNKISKKTLRVYFLEKQIEKYLSNVENEKILKSQEDAINLIRRKIAEVKVSLICNRKGREQKRKERELATIHNFITMYNIDVSRMLSLEQLAKVILEVQEKLKMKRRRHKNNAKSILEKLVKEYKQKMQPLKKKKKVNVLKLGIEKGGKKVFHIVERWGSKTVISCVRILQEENRIHKAFKDAGVCTERENEISEFDHKSTYSQKTYSDMDGTESHTYESIQAMKLDEKKREKLEMIRSFTEFESYLEIRYLLCICDHKDVQRFELLDDVALSATPQAIRIKSYIPGKVYTRKVVFINKAGSVAKMKFSKLICDDRTNNLSFEIDPQVFIVLHPGISVKINVKFCPIDAQIITGHMAFIVCFKSNYYNHLIPVECLPAMSGIIINPSKLSFGRYPIWKFQKSIPDISKQIKIRCEGSGSYKLVVKKTQELSDSDTSLDPNPYAGFNLSSSEDDVFNTKSEDQIMVEHILTDVLSNIFDFFRMDRRFLMMNKNTGENVINMSVANVEYPGFYIEKYQVDIYETVQNEDIFKGIQEITCELEVSDYFLQFKPLCVDFGICFFDIAYQVSFHMTNSSRNTEAVAILIPSILSCFVSTDDTSVYIRPGECRRITLKFLPSKDLLIYKNKYFDCKSAVLEFPIKMKLLNKQYETVPSQMLPGYAIMSQHNNLILEPMSEEHSIEINGEMVLDLGECSVNEVITTDLRLINVCYFRRFYGLINLPRYISITPNNGMGVLSSLNEQILGIYIHPQIEDFTSETQDEDEKNIKISLESLTSSVKYKRKPDMKRLSKLLKMMLEELKKKQNFDMLLDIWNAKYIIATKLSLCTCVDASKNSVQPTEDSEIDVKEVELSVTEVGSVPELPTESEPKLGNKRKKSQEKKRRKSSLKEKKILIVARDVISPTHETMAQETINDQNDKFETDKERTSIITPSPSRFIQMNDNKFVNIIEYQVRIPTNTPASLQMSEDLKMRVMFIKPQYEFSYNHIEFPATPGASFSVMNTELRPLMNLGSDACLESFRKKKKHANCKVTFKITGSTEEVRIEPNYGVLEHGQSIALSLVATPKLKHHAIAAYIFEQKRKHLYDEKMAHELKRREAALLAAAHKSKKKSKKKEKAKAKIESEEPKEESIHIEISPDEINIEYLDFYPAEINLWRSIEPYLIKTNFVCHVEYEMKDSFKPHPDDDFMLETVCKVVPPDFMHDQNLQILDFGNVAVGESIRKIITLQNLRYSPIKVCTNILRTHGHFSCPNFDEVKLESEYFLKIPITYAPRKEERVLEYLDIKAERTIYQFKLAAAAFLPKIIIQPSSNIIRIVVRKVQGLEVPIEIFNQSSFPIHISLEKVFELKGIMSKQSLISEDKPTKKTKEKKKGKVEKRSTIKISDELTEEEVIAIQNNFTINEDFKHFQIPMESTRVHINGSSKKVVGVIFKSPYPPPKKNQKEPEEQMTNPIPEIIVSKINVLLGSSTFIKDFIMIGEFK